MKIQYILSIYTLVKKVKVVKTNEITVRNIQAYMEMVVTKFGSGAKVDPRRSSWERELNF